MRNPDQIRTFHGIDMDPFYPREEHINIEDIAHSLSLVCRANGHIAWFYSVAQHCLNCEKEAKARGYDAHIRLFCLLHDASECYVSDLIRPVKRRFPLYYEVEDRLLDVIYRKLVGENPNAEQQKIVGEIDDCLLYHEFLALCNSRFFDKEPKLYADLSFDCENTKSVRKRYIDRYNELLSELKGDKNGKPQD